MLTECGVARGRQNEPAVEIDPRNANLLIGSSNDYCGVYQPPGSATPSPVGPIWLGYYRSEDGGASFRSSLVPGYPATPRPTPRRPTSGPPARATRSSPGTATAACSWAPNRRTTRPGPRRPSATSSSPSTTTRAAPAARRQRRQALRPQRDRQPRLVRAEPPRRVQRQDGDRGGPDRRPCDGTVYFAWSRFTGNGHQQHLHRPVDRPRRDLVEPEEPVPGRPGRAVPGHLDHGNGHVYVTFRQSERKNGQTDAIDIVKSTDCGATFGAAKVLQPFLPLRRDATSRIPRPHRPATRPTLPSRRKGPRAATPAIAAISAPTASPATRSSGATRRSARPPTRPTPRTSGSTSSTTRASPAARSRPGRRTAPIDTGIGSQSATYFLRYDGATGTKTTSDPDRRPGDRPQLFPDIAVSNGTLHAIWWDSRNDPSYSPDAPRRQRCGGPHRRIARRLRRDVDHVRRVVDRQGADQQHHEQSELRAVRRPDRAVRRRLPVGDGERRPGPSRRGPIGATPSRAPTRARPPRTRTTAAPTSSSAAPSPPPTGGAATPARMTAAWTRTSTGRPLRRPTGRGGGDAAPTRRRGSGAGPAEPGRPASGRPSCRRGSSTPRGCGTSSGWPG